MYVKLPKTYGVRPAYWRSFVVQVVTAPLFFYAIYHYFADQMPDEQIFLVVLIVYFGISIFRRLLHGVLFDLKVSEEGIRYSDLFRSLEIKWSDITRLDFADTGGWLIWFHGGRPRYLTINVPYIRTPFTFRSIVVDVMHTPDLWELISLAKVKNPKVELTPRIYMWYGAEKPEDSLYR